MKTKVKITTSPRMLLHSEGSNLDKKTEFGANQVRNGVVMKKWKWEGYFSVLKGKVGAENEAEIGVEWSGTLKSTVQFRIDG